MSKIDTVRQAMMQAMKDKEHQRKDVLSLLLSALKAKFIDKRADLTEQEENEVILKEIKQTQETIEKTPADRTDILDECRYRISVLSEFAPKMMSEDEIRAEIQKVLDSLGISQPQAKDKGIIMKNLMPAVKGKCDSALVSRMVAQLFE